MLTKSDYVKPHKIKSARQTDVNKKRYLHWTH